MRTATIPPERNYAKLDVCRPPTGAHLLVGDVLSRIVSVLAVMRQARTLSAAVEHRRLGAADPCPGRLSLLLPWSATPSIGVR